MQAEIKAPARACAGAPVTVHYTLGYDFISHHRDDWMGLFEVGANDTPYVQTKHLYNIPCSEIFTLRNENVHTEA